MDVTAPPVTRLALPDSRALAVRANGPEGGAPLLFVPGAASGSRMRFGEELAGTLATHVVGLSERTPARSAEPGVRFPSGKPWDYFYERFHAAYVAELHAFVDLVAGRGENPCSIADASAAFAVADALERSRAARSPVPVLRPAG